MFLFPPPAPPCSLYLVLQQPGRSGRTSPFAAGQRAASRNQPQPGRTAVYKRVKSKTHRKNLSIKKNIFSLIIT